MSQGNPSISASRDRHSSCPSDEQLAQQARAGSADSFEELVRRFQVRLLRFLQRRVRSMADAEDLLQETFVRAYQRLDRYDGSRSFGTWLFTIAHRLSVSHHRHDQAGARATEVIVERYRDCVESEPGRGMADEESRKVFWEQAASVLSEEQMCALWLFYVEQMPAPQIAEVLGRSWVSVKAMLFRARRRLMPVLADYHGIEAMESSRNATGVGSMQNLAVS